MRFRVQVVCLGDDGAEETRAVTEFTRRELVMESLGMTLAEGMAALKGIQEFITERQTMEFLRQAPACERCGRAHSMKSSGTTNVRTVYGSVRLPNPRWHRCRCAPADSPRTFRPLQRWVRGTTSPELLYLESKWAALIPYGGVARLLGDVLPIAEDLNGELVRSNTLRTAERIEAQLGEEKEAFFEGTEDDWERQPIPDGPLTVGIDGGFVKASHKQGFFEVIAGKSVVAFRRDDEAQTPTSKCFSLVQTFDEKPRRRVWELLKSQGMQENQQVVFLSDGGDSVRGLQEYLHPASEHWLDWFHITMRLTVLQQQTKGLHAEEPALGDEIARALTSIKHFLWHGNTFQALRRLEGLLYTLEFPLRRSVLLEKVAKGVREFETYIRNSEELIPNFGERHRMGETITTAFVESTVNQVISKRLVKKQQMQWTPRGAHLLLQVRTKVINDELDQTFRGWYPKFREAVAA